MKPNDNLRCAALTKQQQQQNAYEYVAYLSL